jgi:class 3 adenylate cyclase/pimeloyl-ACP methyl ester carboxylesterase
VPWTSGDIPEHWRKVACCRWQPAVEPELPRTHSGLAGRTDAAKTGVVEATDIQYTRSGETAIAYQVVGDGPIDLVLLDLYGNLLYRWEQPVWVDFFERLSSFSRLILLDKRGTGLSDRTRDLPNLETRMDDIRAVMDATHSERAALFGTEEGGQIAAVFAASYPERTRALCLYNTVARATSALDYPWGRTPEEWRDRIAHVREGWGTVELAEELLGEDFAIPSVGRWWVNYIRLSVSPGAALALYRAYGDTDIRDVLPAIRVPTLVLYRPYAREPALDLARRIPGAVAQERLGGSFYGGGGGEAMVAAVKSFLTDVPTAPVPDAVLATLLFIDIVGSTERVAELGDSRWRELLAAHRSAVRRELALYRGNEIDTAGDGFFASFDGPARAIACARRIVEVAADQAIQVRAGLHTGECERDGERLTGVAVHIGARLVALAQPGEVLVSRTVKDLVAGSGIEFDDRGEHSLKGVPGEWRLYAARPD